MKHFKGDLLEAFKRGEVTDIAHQVNCQGVMGAGVAKQIRTMYPEHYKHYKKGYGLGMPVSTYIRGVDGYIHGLCGQDFYGRDERRYTNYAALITALGYCEFHANDKIGIPKYMGCGLAGGDWNIVETLLKDFEELHGVEFWVYEL